MKHIQALQKANEAHKNAIRAQSEAALPLAEAALSLVRANEAGDAEHARQCYNILRFQAGIFANLQQHVVDTIDAAAQASEARSGARR
jgi:hypothetical protein